MSWHTLALSDCPPQAWRNGGGITHELATWPEPQAWRWRASVARIDRDGDFSAFDGVQRGFAVLTGEGVTLTWPTHHLSLTPESPPVSFAGAPACHARLHGGPTMDFNLMTRGMRAELIQQTHLSAQGVWPAHAHVGVFARTACSWTCDGLRVEQPAFSLRWTQLSHPSSWTWLEGEALVFVLQEEAAT